MTLSHLPAPFRWALLMGLSLAITCCSQLHAVGPQIAI